MKILIKNLQAKIPVSPTRIKKVILTTLSQEGVRPSGEISVLFVEDCQIRELNAKFLHSRRATDVIAFNLSDQKKSGVFVGDIAVSVDTALRNARRFKTTPVYELCLYVAHGALHLLGYDDASPAQQKKMHKKAEKILAALKIK